MEPEEEEEEEEEEEDEEGGRGLLEKTTPPGSGVGLALDRRGLISPRDSDPPKSAAVTPGFVPPCWGAMDLAEAEASDLDFTRLDFGFFLIFSRGEEEEEVGEEEEEEEETPDL